MNALKVIKGKTAIQNRNNLGNFLADKLIISTHSRIDLLPYDEILYLRAESNYSRIITTGKNILASTSLKKFEVKLDRQEFVRVHASYLINLHQLSHIKKNGQISCILKNGESVPVSNKYKKEFIDVILNHKI